MVRNCTIVSGGRHRNCCLALLKLDWFRSTSNEQRIRAVWVLPPPQRGVRAPIGVVRDRNRLSRRGHETAPNYSSILLTRGSNSQRYGLRCLWGNRYKPVKIRGCKSIAGGVSDENLPTHLLQIACFIDRNSGTDADRHDVPIGFPSVNGECH